MKDKTKTYTIEHKHKDGRVYVNRENNGFNAFELLGILEETQLDIIKQMKGEIKPEIIERKFIKESE